jgi:hypothetical protein
MDIGHRSAANAVAEYAFKVVVIGVKGGGTKIEWVRRGYGHQIGRIKGRTYFFLLREWIFFRADWQSQNYPALRRFLADGLRGLAAVLFFRVVGLVLAGSNGGQVAPSNQVPSTWVRVGIAGIPYLW